MAADAWIWQHEESFPSRVGESKRVLECVLSRLETENWFPHEIFGVHLAMEEALTNAIKHGNRFDAAKSVHVVCRLSDDRFYLQICDEGPGFRPADVPDCTQEENLEKASGRGLMLMRNFMSYVEFNPTGNCVVMEKTRGGKRS